MRAIDYRWITARFSHEKFRYDDKSCWRPPMMVGAAVVAQDQPGIVGQITIKGELANGPLLRNVVYRLGGCYAPWTNPKTGETTMQFEFDTYAVAEFTAEVEAEL